MGKIIAVHSFRGGTGKSNITANLASILIDKGKKIGIVDCDIQSPGIHILYNIDLNQVRYTLNDYLKNNCSIEETAMEVLPKKLFLFPSSLDSLQIIEILREGYDAEKLVLGLQEILNIFDLDYLFIDTHPGLNEETLLSISIADVLIVILRPDQQDYQGTAVTVEIGKKLDVPNMQLIVNKCPSTIDRKELKKSMESIYEIPLAAIIPLSEEMVALGSSDIFVKRYPDHEISHILKSVCEQILMG